MKWVWVHILLIIILLGFRNVEAQKKAVFSSEHQTLILKLSSSRELPYKIIPGSAISFPVFISSSSTDTLRQVIDLPTGWRNVFFSDIIHTSIGDTLNQLVSILIPLNTKAGSYNINYKLIELGNESVVAQVNIPVVVKNKISVALEQMDYSRLLIAGDSYRFGYSLINRSNTDVPIRLLLNTNLGKVTTDSSVYHLKMGETRQIYIKIMTPENIKDKRRLMIRTEAIVRDSLLDTKTAGADLFPKLNKGNLVYHTFPIYVKGLGGLQQTEQSKHWLYNYSISGGGTFVDNGSAELDFLFHGPKRLEQQNLFLPSRDEYQIRFKDNNWNIKAGDNTYQTTPLLGSSYYGFGGGASANISHLSISSFYAHNRFSYFPQNLASGQLKWRVSPSLQMSLNGLWKNDYIKGQIVSARTEWMPIPAWKITGEAGLSDSPSGRSHAVEWSSEFNKDIWHWNIEYDWHGARYPTYEQGAQSVMGSASVILFKNVSIFDRMQKNKQLIFDNVSNRAGITISRNISLYHEYSRQKISNVFSAADNVRQLAGLMAGYNRNRFRIGMDVTYAKIDYRLTGHTGQNFRFAIRSGFSIGRSLSFSGGVTYTNGQTLYSELYRSQIGSYASLDMHLGHFTELTLRGSLYQYDQITQQYALSGNQILAELSHRFSFGHEMAVKAGYQEHSLGRNISGVVISYQIPIGLHTQRSRSSGLVSGRIIDDVTGKGLPNIPIFLGESGAVSDKKGQFFLPHRKPGSYKLLVAADDLPDNRILDQDYPISVKVQGGNVTNINIHSIASGGLLGKAILKEKGVITQINPLSGAVVELKGKNKIFRRLTDNSGKFRFSGLKPGNYSIKLLQRFLPEGYTNRNKERVIKITGGETDTLTMYAVPLERHIRFLNSKPISLDTKNHSTDILNTEQKVYRIKPGDWLAKIAQNVYGDSNKWKIIYESNKDIIDDPNKIYPGMVLKIPNVNDR